MNLNPVKLDHRFSFIKLCLLWLTMVSSYPIVMGGFELGTSHYSIAEIVLNLIISCLILTAYTFWASYLGSATGLTFTVMSRAVFGRIGSYFISFVLIIIATLWYSITAVFFSQSLINILNLNLNIGITSIIMVALMSFNNLFGFKGVSNFASFFAAPILILWILLVFIKIFPFLNNMLSTSSFYQIKTLHYDCFNMTASLVLGFGAWGNEADFWRYSKPEKLKILVVIIFCVFVGQLIFPLAGLLFSQLDSKASVGQLPELISKYSLYGSKIFTLIIIMSSYFAINDSSLYGITNAINNIKTLNRNKIIVVFIFIASIISFNFANYPQVYLIIANFSASIIPQASLLLLLEWIFFQKMNTVNFVNLIEDNVSIKWIGIISLVFGYLFGLRDFIVNLTNFDNLNNSNVLLNWLVSCMVYIILRLFFMRDKIVG